ncbi:hypothetical protein NDS46_31700 (plasmid) [Paenibacillus thiaminolyticus]|uniref:hypothetical protein n=1 Tax=Paenibacillus thiaminolyticus TaxID=49283 RepID=UPI00232B9200|nr:hypothetical protein [Paenibacillus thiaminolyticus]WCF11524.1 hypothetical protein NDS46_31700 [Paenibacillus thiaminolyticus]
MKSMLLMPYVLDVLERNIERMTFADLKMSKLFISHFEKVQDTITKDIYSLRKTMREKGIKILEEKKCKNHLHVRYICRGYTHSMSFLWSKVRTDVEVILAKYLDVDLDNASIDIL